MRVAFHKGRALCAGAFDVSEGGAVFTRTRTVAGAFVLVWFLARGSAQEQPPAAAQAGAAEVREALSLYRNGRSMDTSGRREDAQKMYTQAVELCRSVLERDPRHADAYAVCTWSLFRLGRYADTVALCQEALKISVDHRVVETLAEALFFVGDYKGSMHAMERYIDMAPRGERISVAYFYLGEIFRLTKRFRKADIAYSAAVNFEPSNALWWYRLGLAREYAGDKGFALDAYRRALHLRPEYKEAQESIRRLS
nr:tetratricopeptide repeat protein [Treponema pallidum]